MICIFEWDATDFDTNGLGVLQPSMCVVNETLNGEYEVTMEHPLDENGKWRKLQEGRILRVPVPAAASPQVELVTQQSWEIYQVNAKRRPLRAKPKSNGRILKKYKKYKKVTILEKGSTWYSVIGPDGKHGYMDKSHLTYVETKYSAAEATGEVVEPAQLRDQPFRIYRIVPDMEKVTVYARHLFYDLLDNMITSITPSASMAGATLVQEISDGALDEHEFDFYSDLTSTATDVEIENVNPIDALMGDGGLIENYGGEICRDWYDVYVVERVGVDTDIHIREGKNLLGVSYDVDTTNVVTRIVPTGEDASGNTMYLPEVSVDSDYIESYPHPKYMHLAVSEAKEVVKGSNRKSKADCYTEMRNAAQDAFDGGCDLPDVTLTVDFVNVAETEEYKDYELLQNIYIGDAVTIDANVLTWPVTMRLVEYEYDCIIKKYTKMVLGSATEALEGIVISSRQIPSGSIGGSKLKPNSVGSLNIKANSIVADNIAAEAIEARTIAAQAITAEKLAAGAVYAQALEAVNANIENLTAGRINTDELYATMAQIASAEIQNATIASADIGTLAAKLANIAQAMIEGADITEARIDDADIQTLAATLAQIIELTAQDARIEQANIDWAHIGSLTAQTETVAQTNIGTAAISSANIDWAAIGSMATTLANINEARIHSAQIDQADIDELDAGIANVLTITAQHGDFEFATVQRLLASSFILEQGVGDTLFIKNLTATSAMFVSATLGDLCLKGDDGKYYNVSVAADGTIHTEDTGYTDADIIDGHAPDGKSVVIATEAAIDELNSTNIRAQSAIMTQIFTKALDAETISASEAFLASATIPQLYVTAIAALGDSLDLSANQSIRLAVGDAIVSRQRWYQLQPAGQAAPAKPAVNPPGGAWTDEEPAFEIGSRNKFGPNENPSEDAYIVANGAVVAAGWTDVSGGDGAVLTMEVGTATAGQYRCIVTDANGDAVTTEAAALAVGTKALPLITAQPQNAFAAKNSTVELTVEAENVASYQWQWKAITDTTWANLAATNTSYPGGTTKTVSFELTAQRSSTSRHYRCVLTNSAGSVITDVVAATIDTGENAYIAAQPRSATVALGGTATFSVAAENARSYMWQYNNSGTWNNCSATLYPDRTTDTLTVGMTANRDGWQYRCVVTGLDGVSVESDPATLNLAGQPAITTQPQDQTGETGDTVAFTVAAAGAEPLTYQWQKLSRAVALNWTISDYIAVEPGTEYYFQPNTTAGSTAKHAFYDESLDFISAVASGPGAFTTPEGCRFMRFSYRSASDDIQLEIGDAPTDWEPYDPERRYVLYFVDLNEYAGGTWEYGDVCVSSGYEAAKAADSAQSAADDNAAGIDTLNDELQAVQDAADAAMGAVRSLAVGGVNLIDDSAQITITGTDDPATSYLELASGLLPGTVYTLGMASAVLAAGSAAGMTLEAVRQSDDEILFTDTLDFSGGHQKHTFATGEGDATYALRLYAGIKGAGNGVTVELEKVKLEQGTFATMWTESPADAEQKLAALTSQLNLTQGGLEDIVTHVTQDVDGTIRSVNSYFRFDGSDPNNPKLIIGSSVSPMTMELTNSRLSFLWNGDPVAYFSDNKLYVTNVEAIERMSVGTPQNGYMDIVTTATGVGFMWRS